jgi:hypothetical protein
MKSITAFLENLAAWIVAGILIFGLLSLLPESSAAPTYNPSQEAPRDATCNDLYPRPMTVCDL